MIVWSNSITNERTDTRPWRVRLPDLSTRTGFDLSDELLALCGWTSVEEIYISNDITNQTTSTGVTDELSLD